MNTTAVRAVSGVNLRPTRPIVLVSDTDLHGVSLAAAYFAILSKSGEENVSVVSHFDPRGPATAARGDLPAALRQVAEGAEGARVYLLDIPVKQGAEKETAEALAEIAGRAQQLTIIDHHIEVLNAVKEAGVQLPHADWKLYADAFSTYLPALASAIVTGDEQLARHIYDLAVLGLVSDMDLEALGIAQKLAPIVGAEVPTLDEIRRNYHIVVAIDAMVKAPQKPSIETDVELLGNMAGIVPYLAKKRLNEIASEALQRFPTPTPEEVAAASETIKGVVVLYKKLAPVGQAYKYAALLEAATDAPIVVSVAPLPRVNDYVVLIAVPNAFLGSEVVAEVSKFLAEVKDTIVKELEERGLTKKEWLRPGPSFSIPVDAQRWEEAAELIANRLATLWAERHREKLAAQITREELTVLVADERLAASVARIVESAVEAAMRRIEQLLKERR